MVQMLHTINTYYVFDSVFRLAKQTKFLGIAFAGEVRVISLETFWQILVHCLKALLGFAWLCLALLSFAQLRVFSVLFPSRYPISLCRVSENECDL